MNRAVPLPLLGAEDPVARVAQAGNDIAMLIEVLIQRADIEIYIRVRLGKGLHAFRSGNDAQEMQVPAAVLFEHGDQISLSETSAGSLQ